MKAVKDISMEIDGITIHIPKGTEATVLNVDVTTCNYVDAQIGDSSYRVNLGWFERNFEVK